MGIEVCLFVGVEVCSFDVCVFNHTESEGGHPPFYKILSTMPLVGVYLRAHPEA